MGNKLIEPYYSCNNKTLDLNYRVKWIVNIDIHELALRGDNWQHEVLE
jgi:hypothetical protein